VDLERFRSEFPVLARRAYLNTGTDGPFPAQAAAAASEQLAREAAEGRSGSQHFDSLERIAEELRGRLARLLGADTDEVALTRSTTDGMNVVLSGLPLAPGDEVLTSDEEHAGLLAPLAALGARGVVIRQAPFGDVASAIGPRTKLIAVSHVSWISGKVAPVADLAASGLPVLVDGAQGLGAIPVDVRALGCDFYAAAGQKWLCGPDATGVLYIQRNRIDQLGMPSPGHVCLSDAARPLDLPLAAGARRFDGGMIAGPLIAAALAALDVLEEAGWDWVFDRARTQAARLRELLADRVEVVPGGPTTLVSWQPPGITDAAGAEELVERLAADDVIVRAFPGRALVRASVGAWNSDGDLDRLAARL
jgi:L-cysteine/cystine lyase